jgi:putative DNA primase/helicase
MSDTEKLDQGTNPLNQGNTYELTSLPQSYSGSNHPIQKIRIAIQKMESAPMVDLAEKYYGKSTLNENGETRKLQNSEVVVLVPDHFKIWLEEIGMGLCSINGTVHVFVGTHWQPMQDNECKILLGEIAARIGHDASDSKSWTFCNKILEQLHFSLSTIAIESKANRVLINFRNGTLEFFGRTEVLRDFRKEDNLNYLLPFDYDEEAECPMFDKFLLKVLPDSQSRNILSEFLGWIFLKDLNLEKALFLYGSGHNGKSVIFKVVNAMLGKSNCGNLSMSALSKEEKRFELGSVLVNFSSEMSDRCHIDLFKKLTSGEPVEARRLYNDVYTLYDYGRLVFNTNVLPQNTEQTEGFFRRFLIIPFTVLISQEEKDADLPAKIIAAELSGVFNWVMQGLRRLRETRKLSECLAANTVLRKYRKESDTVALFLDEKGFKASPKGKITKDELFKEYHYFCTSGGYKSMAKNKFGDRLRLEHHIEGSHSGSYRFWRLIRTKPE